MTERLSPFAEDILRETMNIGGAHAVNALSQMLAVPIAITVPSIALQPIEALSHYIEMPDATTASILQRIAGDISGFIILSFPEHDVCTLARHLRTHPIDQTHDLCLEILSEVGNIISGSCFASLNRFLGLTFDRSVPNATIDMNGALINSILADMGQLTNDALVTQLLFSIDSLNICGTVFLILDPDSTQNILQAAHRKLHSL